MNRESLAVIEKHPDQTVIDCIEVALAKAKTGELSGVVIIGSYDDNCTSLQWAGVKRNTVRITGALFCAATELAGLINADV